MKITHAEWRPGWYELDQALEVGRAAQFAFFPPRTQDPSEPLVFYNTLWEPKDAVAARGTVTRITHPALGAISRVETEGLDYTFVLADGKKFIVDAEEEPGQLMEQSEGTWRRLSTGFVSWNLLIAIADLTPLEPAPRRLEQR